MSHHNEATFCATCGHRTDASGICTYERQANFARFLSDVADRVAEKLAEKRAIVKATLQAVPELNADEFFTRRASADPIASYPDADATLPEPGSWTSCPLCGNSVDLNGYCLRGSTCRREAIQIANNRREARQVADATQRAYRALAKATEPEPES